ncbi:SEC-C metal-binding domain-containing protein [Streptococcus mutans]|uniref:SEC-C metal-binding domain-containing protein n=1 Tax=Streptococcus mutans TaxID=1309 RepID=UPI0002B5588C|nr:SEC-C metal-binding domain-containing protein [Streptococcus mutans]EMC07438.1 hypothetical protein SMU69_01367 [Streptococcus mutans NLML4]EMC40009.1 hypothetical protein SMU95_03856 [Streptococcus mutans B]EMC45515.1 hypothetical protein SMU98_01493 [Streptococcus mutans SM1]MCB4945359.1 SEC-C domain-containing protein [Streptococcus mutans]MCB4958516.1 SEC-C domain-containing protein [Streptococcus mutans]
MTNNDYIICKTCDEVINIRIQMGYYDVPFNVNCPKCQTLISGKVILKPYGINMKNAYHLNSQPDFPYWCIELSAELPTRKIYMRKGILDNLSPFMAQMNRFSSDEANDYMEKIASLRRFADYSNSDELSDFINLYRLYWNNQQNYLYPKLEENLIPYKSISPITKIKNKIDATMALHQLLIVSTGISSILDESILKQYNDLGERIFSNCMQISILEYIEYIKKDFDAIERKALNLVEDFSKIYYQLIPVVSLLVSNKYDEVNQKDYGITTANYQELKKFYAESYEWILDNINIIIGLNNIFVRGNFSKCLRGKNYKENLEKVRNKFNEFSNYIDKNEPFSKPMDNLNNNIRNAIQHYNDEIDYASQIITFEDKHAGHTNVEKISLMDFAKLCLENFRLIFYILEIVYNFRKLDLMVNGIIATVFVDEEKEVYASNGYIKKPRKVNKISRNSPCPCGSGKKYKKCCGKIR